MRLYDKVRAVEKLFSIIDKDIKKFQIASGINCISGCSHCCFNPEIEATVLGFLPLAYNLLIEDKIEDFYNNLNLNIENKICFLLSPLWIEEQQGMCSKYEYRALICRLFGFSQKINKYGEPEFFTCRKIKENFHEKYIIVKENVGKFPSLPIVSNYYMRLSYIDYDLNNRFYPINEAILKSLIYVMNYYTFRKIPRKAG